MDWIKVTPETMPPERTPVLITAFYNDCVHPINKSEGCVYCAMYENGRWWTPWENNEGKAPLFYKLTVTHWMPYPKPAED